MTITYGFFAKKEGVTPADRSYTQIILAQFFKWLFPLDGIVKNEGSELTVSALASPNMSVNIAAGVAVAGGSYWLKSTATENIGINNADPTHPRIDLVVARFRLTGDSYRDAIFAVVPGTPAVSPVAPTVTRDTDTYEVSLATVAVAAGASQILPANITDQRDTASCGWLSARLGKMYIESGGNLNAAGLRIVNLANPVNPQDADTKVARETYTISAIATAIACIVYAQFYTSTASDTLIKDYTTQSPEVNCGSSTTQVLRYTLYYGKNYIGGVLRIKAQLHGSNSGGAVMQIRDMYGTIIGSVTVVSDTYATGYVDVTVPPADLFFHVYAASLGGTSVAFIKEVKAYGTLVTGTPTW